MGLLSGERFGFHTAVLALLHVELPPSMPDRHLPFSNVSVIICVMLWSAVFHSSDATALFPKNVLTPGQETNTVPWSALLTSGPTGTSVVHMKA